MRLPIPMVMAIAKNWPFANGSGRFIDRFSTDTRLGEGPTTARTSDGFSIDVLADDHIGNHILMTGQFDRTPIQVLIDFSNSGDEIADIGANIGYVSAVLLTMVPESRVTSVEPQPMIVDILRKNLARFPENRTHLVCSALSDRSGKIMLHIDKKNRGASSIHGGDETDAVEVSMLSTDDFLATFQRLDLVKIDVEGHEESVLGNASLQLDRLKPRAIQFEDRDGEAAPDGRVGGLLASRGYLIFGIDKHLLSTKLRLIRVRADCAYNDYVALHPDRASEMGRGLGKYGISLE
jgi:FkbM family methyltransferase